MSSHPLALLIDDGELCLVRALLEDIGGEFWHLRGSKVERPIPSPARLLITTARLAVALPCRRTRKGDGTDPVWMAFVQGNSKTLRQLLRRNGFDFLIPEPVHPAALRLLMMRAVFDGADTQDVERVASGDEIRFGTALRHYPAVMIDVSPRGCRFLAEKAPKVGAKITIQIPPDEPTGKALRLDGIVTRTNPAELEGGERGQTAVGVRFKPMRRPQAERLKEVLRARKTGPKPLLDAEISGPATPPTLDPELEATRPPLESPLRPRGVFEGHVEAFCAGATRLLVGRDLSEKGMLVEPNVKLKVGERVHLSLYGAAREEPMLIEAHVGRDDGKRGLALYFDWLEPDALERLRRLVQTLPQVYRLEDDTQTHTAVFAQLLPRLKRSG